MNGYVKLETAEGEPIVVNVDRVNFVRRFRGGDNASAVNFEKGNYIVVKGSLTAVLKASANGSCCATSRYESPRRPSRRGW